MTYKTAKTGSVIPTEVEESLGYWLPVTDTWQLAAHGRVNLQPGMPLVGETPATDALTASR
jgi:hypothetical protein